MAFINFVIPGNKSDLLNDVSDEYCVNNVTGVKELPSVLKEARSLFRDCGPEFILDHFDAYYSVLHHGDSLTMDVIHKAYEDLHKVVSELNKAIGFLLEDKDSLNDEGKLKYLNVMKMLIYLYTQIVLLIEKRNVAKNDQLVRVRKKSAKDQDEYILEKKAILLLLYNIIQREISLFWEPPVVEESLINLISGVCYELLQNPVIKNEKEELVTIFNIIGYLVKVYNHGTTFVVRITQLIKLQEHFVHCIPKGIQQIVQNFNCKGLLHDMIEELTEWQTDEKTSDSQGARYCASVLSEMAALMPDLMLPEVMSLNSYLYHDPPSLRISVLMVMVEVVLNNLTGHDLTDEQREFRDELLEILIDHMDDEAVLVRAKVLQQWARLQKESAIPLKYQEQVLENVVAHLFDKGALARKAAASCVTTFLSYNAYSANLSLSAIQEQLNSKDQMLNVLKEKIKDPKMERIMELQSQWDAKIDELKSTVQTMLDKEKENIEEQENNQIPIEQVPDVIRLYINDNKFKEAFLVCNAALKDTSFLKDFQEVNDESEDLNLYMTILHSIYFDVAKIMKEIGNKQLLNISDEDLAKYSELELEVEFLKQCVGFLKLIDSAMGKFVELLETTSITDMHEAIEFFVEAYQFNIDDASRGILAMLKLMQRNEQERKDAVVAAFKKIYLQTEASNMTEHCTIIVGRLLRLVETVSVNNIDDFQDIIADWTAKGTLDNAMIDMLWQYVTLRIPVKEEEVCAALEILRMAAIGRKTIISRNIDVVVNIGFGDRGRENMVLLGSACKLLSTAYERVDINSKNFSFKLKPDNQCFKDLVEILSSQFVKPVKFYHKGLYGAIEFVYKMCSKPETVCEDLLNNILPSLEKKQREFPDFNLPNYVLIRLCQMCGYIALKHLEYMDDTVYKELKRRNNVREERKKEKEQSNPSKQTKKKKGPSRKSVVSASTASEASMLNTSVAEESTLEGAQAEDTDAEFILNVLENDTVTGSGGLAKLAPLIINICERPDVYKNKDIQGASITALMRFMLVSSKFCAKHIQLIFTIFERTSFPEVKINILVHVSDLLTRFPNVIEPWTPRIFQSLNDSEITTRLATFFTLSSLILRDMIRAHSHIPEMATCLANSNPELKAMCKTFFIKLSHKENNLYNALPDIFTHLINTENMKDEDVQEIMKFLFELIDSTKHMESLVDRFCSKFKMTEEVRHHRCISYCLCLIKYNEKALRKLIDNFPNYKDLVHDSEIYANFSNIMQNSSKQQPGKADLKPIVTELENNIKSVFELNEDGQMPPPPPPKSARKPRAKKKVSAKKRAHNDDSDEELNYATPSKSQNTPVRKSSRKRVQQMIDSDSD